MDYTIPAVPASTGLREGGPDSLFQDIFSISSQGTTLSDSVFYCKQIQRLLLSPW